MSIVAGVDFGTLNVRVSIFDSARGRLGAGVAEYPLLRKKDDPLTVKLFMSNVKIALAIVERSWREGPPGRDPLCASQLPPPAQ